MVGLNRSPFEIRQFNTLLVASTCFQRLPIASVTEVWVFISCAAYWKKQKAAISALPWGLQPPLPHSLAEWLLVRLGSTQGGDQRHFYCQCIRLDLLGQVELTLELRRLLPRTPSSPPPLSSRTSLPKHLSSIASFTNPHDISKHLVCIRRSECLLSSWASHCINCLRLVYQRLSLIGHFLLPYDSLLSPSIEVKTHSQGGRFCHFIEFHTLVGTTNM